MKHGEKRLRLLRLCYFLCALSILAVKIGFTHILDNTEYPHASFLCFLTQKLCQINC